jgi:hypothetical protein
MRRPSSPTFALFAAVYLTRVEDEPALPVAA